MHPKEFFNRNPFGDDGKGGKGREEKERSHSAPSDRKPFKYSSPPKSVCSFFLHIHFSFVLLDRWK